MDRRSFVKRAGAAGLGAAALGVTGAASAGAAERGEVTVVSGTRETTYRDHALVRRLMRAAGKRGVI